MPAELTWAHAFVAASATLIGLGGLMHLVITIFTNKLEPSDPLLAERVRTAPINISPAAAFGPAMKGFNLSHSIGFLLFAAVYAPLALAEPDLLERSLYLRALGVATLVGLAVIARRYWFVAPFGGVAIATVVYTVGMIGLPA
jgi:hypothetical protein